MKILIYLLFLFLGGCMTLKEGQTSLYKSKNVSVTGSGDVHYDYDNFGNVIREFSFSKIGIEF